MYKMKKLKAPKVKNPSASKMASNAKKVANKAKARGKSVAKRISKSL